MGALGKLFSDAVENIDMKPVDGLIATGATWWEDEPLRRPAASAHCRPCRRAGRVAMSDGPMARDGNARQPAGTPADRLRLTQFAPGAWRRDC
jgi:hypothetical protein